MEKILIIEDEKHIVRVIRDSLEEKGFIVLAARDGVKGLELALNEEIAVVILDIMIPGMTGFQVCKKIKKRKITLPVIILSSKSDEADKIMGLELGADDYMTKPFSVKELCARVNVCLRRALIHKNAKNVEKDVFEIDDIKIDFLKMETYKGGKKVKLSKKEYDILRYFINRKGEVISRNDLLDIVWGYETSPLTRTVDTFISRLRRKLETDASNPLYLKSVRNAGYKLDI
jgi:two-component system alkaline phosphatase synthesis response regulator PhoP